MARHDLPPFYGPVVVPLGSVVVPFGSDEGPFGSDEGPLGSDEGPLGSDVGPLWSVGCQIGTVGERSQRFLRPASARPDRENPPHRRGNRSHGGLVGAAAAFIRSGRHW